MPFHQGCDVTVLDTAERIALPMTRDGAVFNLCGSIAEKRRHRRSGAALLISLSRGAGLRSIHQKRVDRNQHETTPYSVDTRSIRMPCEGTSLE
jgi:hypothetical protein